MGLIESHEQGPLCPTCGRRAIKLKPLNGDMGCPKKYCDGQVRTYMYGEKIEKFCFNTGEFVKAMKALNLKYGVEKETASRFEAEAKI